MKDNLTEGAKHSSIIVIMRGLAALCVCMFHFTKGFVDEDGLARALFRNGWMGVEVFFVISGFVLPYSLLVTSYKFRDYGNFLKKRFFRIEPAYFTSILVVLFLGYLSSISPGFKGAQINISFSLIIQHIGYLVGILGNTWLNVVYWTLEIEFHYYLIIGLLIALWNQKKQCLTVLSITAFLFLSVFSIKGLAIFQFTDLFTLGIVIAFFKKNQLEKYFFLAIVSVVISCVALNHGLIIAILSALSTFLIAFYNNDIKNRLFLFLGKISFSLYLLHVPIGGRVINLSKRLILTEIEKFCVIMLALLFSIIASMIFYKFVEKPSHEYAKRIKLFV